MLPNLLPRNWLKDASWVVSRIFAKYLESYWYVGHPVTSSGRKWATGGCINQDAA